MTDPSIATNDCSNCTKLSTSDDLAKGCDSTKDQKICGDGLYCCPKAAGTPCSPPTGGVKGTINPFSCSCPDGQGENADRVCKPCTDDDVCCGIKLNTKIPFIGNCIENTTQGGTMDEGSAFPILITALMKILITAILIVSFILIIIGGVMIATGGASPENVTTGKKMIKNVIIGLAILGAIGVILRLINPNFFG
ncbi:MAG: pilin [Candidatus Absconditabacterales bacterium]